MSEALSLDQTENSVLSCLSNSGEYLSARDIQESTGINMALVIRALSDIRKHKPSLIDLSEGKYKFIGNTDDIDGHVGQKEVLSVNMGGSEAYDAESLNLGPVDHQILELLTVKKKVPLSGMIRQFNLEDDEANQILEELREKKLLTKEHIEDFDEDCFSISQMGKEVVEQTFSEPLGSLKSNIYPLKTSSKEEENEPEKPIAAPSEATMSNEARVFEIPSFDNIPEENASSRGRPTGDRDYENLRICMLGYIEENEPCAKSNISHTLARLLSNFGRQTIRDEVDHLVDLDFVKVQVSGKREVFSLTNKGKNVIEQVRAGKAVEPLVAGSTPVKSASVKKETASAKKKEAPAKVYEASKVEPAHREAIATQAASQAPSQPVYQAPSQPVAAQKVDYPSALSGDASDVRRKIDAILSQVPGDNGYQLKYCFDQLFERINHLEKSNRNLKEMHKNVIEQL